MSFNPINIIFNNKDNSDIIQCVFELTIFFKDSIIHYDEEYEQDNGLIQVSYNKPHCDKNSPLPYNSTHKKIFREISLSKYSKLITTDDKILFNTIKSFILKVTLYRFTKEYFTISHEFTENDINIFKNDDIYIEFTQNNEGFLNCCCNLITLDNNRMFVTPPNY